MSYATHPANRRLLAGMNRAALFAGSNFNVVVKSSVKGRKVSHEVGHGYFDAMDTITAFETIPFERVQIAWTSRSLDNEPDRSRLRPLW